MTKMAKWNAGTESGILRKKSIKDKHEDLLVFGYACKLFRDDEKALYIDQGKHLIPWMGEDNLKIDRYDCRGALSELYQYEAGREDYDATRWLGLSESERRIELLCDEERYYALKHNEEELEMYKEEELKRLHQKGSEIQYNYDVPTDPENSQEVPEEEEQEDEAFIPPPELAVPADIEVPKTVKENARIEKTAIFISKQGPQMEILIKTKQSDNPQFSFMNKDDTLYKYYKHLLMAIKSGQYKAQSQNTSGDQKLDDSNEQDGNEDHYLHPSLFATSLQSAPPPLPTVVYKPSADCTYSQLVNRIQGTQSESSTPPPLPTVAPEAPQTQMTYEQQQQYYQQYYYAAQYYEYYKQMAQQFQGQPAQPQDKLPPEAAVFAQNQVYTPGQTAPNLSFVQNQAGYTQYLQQQASTNPYAQIVSNLSHNKDMVAAYSNFMQTDMSQVAVVQNSDITKAPILYNQGEPQAAVQNVPTVVQPEAAPIPQPAKTSVAESQPPLEDHKPPVVKKPLLSLAEYGSDSENENCSDGEEAGRDANLKIPPGETQQIIDKMASYVVKNGKDFESIVRSKGDPRFEFLNESHEHHPYYRLKIREYSGLPVNAENGDRKDAKEHCNGAASRAKEKKIITPVSFSIKKPKEEMPKEIKSALPVEESDEDQEEEAPSKTPPAVPSSNPALPVTTTNTTCSSTSTPTTSSASIVPAKLHPASLTPPSRSTNAVLPDIDRLQDTGHENKEAHEENGKKSAGTTERNKPVDADDLILEMIDLTDDLEERRETRRAEDRKKDKIAAAAREKLALQLERKKKAAAFLKLKSVETSKSDTPSKSESKTERSRRSEKSRDASESKHSTPKKAKSSKVKERVDPEVLKIEDSESEEGEIRKHKKSSKKKKSHKRKHSKSRHESKGRHKSKEHKKSKKKRKRSESGSSHSSVSSQ